MPKKLLSIAPAAQRLATFAEAVSSAPGMMSQALFIAYGGAASYNRATLLLAKDIVVVLLGAKPVADEIEKLRGLKL